MRDTPVSRILATSPALLAPDADQKAIREALTHSPKGDFLVVDDDGRLTGIVTLEDLRPLLFSDSDDDRSTARQFAREPSVLLLHGDNLADALDRMEQCDDDFIPVVSDRESRHVVGTVKKRDLVREHNRALVESSHESRGGTL